MSYMYTGQYYVMMVMSAVYKIDTMCKPVNEVIYNSTSPISMYNNVWWLSHSVSHSGHLHLQSQCIIMYDDCHTVGRSTVQRWRFILLYNMYVFIHTYMLAGSNICVNMYVSVCILVIRGYNNGHTEGHLSPNGAKSSRPQDHPSMIFCIIGHHHCHKYDLGPSLAWLCSISSLLSQGMMAEYNGLGFGR